MLVIADSSALVALSTCGCLELLDKLFGEIKVPLAVYEEVCILNKAESTALNAYLSGKVCHETINVNILKTNGLGKGEVSAMHLYKALAANLLLIDDARARKVAYINNIEVMGSLGVLLLAKQKGMITTIKPLLIKLQDSQIYISDHLVAHLLFLAGESGL